MWQQWIISVLGIPKCGGGLQSELVHVLARIICIFQKKSYWTLFLRHCFPTVHLHVCAIVVLWIINRLDERWLWIIYNDKTSSFADLLAKDGSVTIHTRNLQVLATEM